MSIVARSLLGDSLSEISDAEIFDFSTLRSLRSDGVIEKNATSDPEINAEHRTSTINPIMVHTIGPVKITDQRSSR